MILKLLTLATISLLVYQLLLFGGHDSGLVIRDLTWGDINFVHTTDTHGWYSGHLNQKQYHANWGDFISFVKHMKQRADDDNVDLLVIDTGDRHDGNGLSDATVPNGKRSLPIFIKQDYDLVTIGNHELYEWSNSKQEIDVVVQRYGENYISSNVEYLLSNGSYTSFGQKFRYFVTPKKKLRVLSFAFLFDFTRNNDKTRVYSIEEVILSQQWFNETINAYPEESVDIIVIPGHIPVSHTWDELYKLQGYLRRFYPNIVIQYFGGHSHIRDFTIFDQNLTGLESGRFCETVGWASVKFDDERDMKRRFSRSYIDFNLDSFLHHTHIDSIDEFNTAEGTNVSLLIKQARKDLQLHKVLGYVKENYYLDYVPVSHPKSIFQLLTKTVMKTLPRDDHNPNRIIIINTGSVRYDLYKGPYTLDSQYIVSPFENDWVKISVAKGTALRLQGILNRSGYIMEKNLLPPHQYDMLLRKETAKAAEAKIEGAKTDETEAVQQRFQYPRLLNEADLKVVKAEKLKLSKGYVTRDDFGTDGDDTLHRPVVNFPVPNVVQSEELHDVAEDEDIDVVFYSFITSNILSALKSLNYNVNQEDVQFYSNKYLGHLLNDYVKNLDN